MLVPRRVRWRTFNFQTIIHQKLVEFPVLVIRAQRQFRVLYRVYMMASANKFLRIYYATVKAYLESLEHTA